MTVPTGTLPPAGATAVTEGGENELLSAADMGKAESVISEIVIVNGVSLRMIILL